MSDGVSGSGFIYFVGTRETVKIGWALNRVDALFSHLIDNREEDVTGLKAGRRASRRL